MASTRDLIAEIAEVRGRREHGFAMVELLSRLHAINDAFAKANPEDVELYRYFPVALIACLEGYFRMSIKELIDAGEPYLSNAERPANGLKFDFSLMKAINGKSITLGELIAHGTPLSRLEHIEGIMSTLIGTSFLSALRTVVDRWEHEIEGKPATPILQDPDTVFKAVKRTFELRHIICHEIASGYVIQNDEISQCLDSCVLFLKAANELISNTMQPNAPLTQTAMNMAAAEEYEAAKAELESVLSGKRDELGVKAKEAFDLAHDKWVESVDAWARFVAQQVEGGSMWSMVYSSAKTELTTQRIDFISSWRPLGG